MKARWSSPQTPVQAATSHGHPDHDHTTCQSTTLDLTCRVWIRGRGTWKWGFCVQRVGRIWLRSRPVRHVMHPIAQGTTFGRSDELSENERREQRQSQTRNSKNAIIPTAARKWAIEAITAPNFPQHVSSIGPRKRDTINRTSNTAGFQTIGPKEMMAMRTRGLAGWMRSGPYGMPWQMHFRIVLFLFNIKLRNFMRIE